MMFLLLFKPLSPLHTRPKYATYTLCLPSTSSDCLQHYLLEVISLFFHAQLDNFSVSSSSCPFVAFLTDNTSKGLGHSTSDSNPASPHQSFPLIVLLAQWLLPSWLVRTKASCSVLMVVFLAFTCQLSKHIYS